MIDNDQAFQYLNHAIQHWAYLSVTEGDPAYRTAARIAVQTSNMHPGQVGLLRTRWVRGRRAALADIAGGLVAPLVVHFADDVYS